LVLFNCRNFLCNEFYRFVLLFFMCHTL
jgi:hypothetical protein